MFLTGAALVLAAVLTGIAAPFTAVTSGRARGAAPAGGRLRRGSRYLAVTDRAGVSPRPPRVRRPHQHAIFDDEDQARQDREDRSCRRTPHWTCPPRGSCRDGGASAPRRRSLHRGGAAHGGALKVARSYGRRGDPPRPRGSRSRCPAALRPGASGAAPRTGTAAGAAAPGGHASLERSARGSGERRALNLDDVLERRRPDASSTYHLDDSSAPRDPKRAAARTAGAPSVTHRVDRARYRRRGEEEEPQAQAAQAGALHRGRSVEHDVAPRTTTPPICCSRAPRWPCRRRTGGSDNGSRA
ncbi:hypothetical protein QJS66_20995 [Kocuria rhizophila]|nr:hypothetical protein QJS66_20995 [Kocuria rhizophila]